MVNRDVFVGGVMEGVGGVGGWVQGGGGWEAWRGGGAVGGGGVGWRWQLWLLGRCITGAFVAGSSWEYNQSRRGG